VIAGVVLCGGASRRMGRDKSTLAIEGVPMARRVADALAAAGCDPVVAVGGDAKRLRAAGLEVVPDTYPGEGPLGGIVTALRWSPAPAVFVAACDLPWLQGPTVAAVAAPGQLAVAHTGRREPLCACWPVAVIGAVERAFAAGERSVYAVLAQLDVVDVTVPSAELRNVNTSDDLTAGG
jgi:molybdopterin-guanine dinucleotide biosynthesis protein A